MKRLFPGGRERKLGLIEHARGVLGPPSEEAGSLGRASPANAPVTDRAEPEEGSASAPARTGARSGWRLRSGTLVAAALGGGIALGYGALPERADERASAPKTHESGGVADPTDAGADRSTKPWLPSERSEPQASSSLASVPRASRVSRGTARTTPQETGRAHEAGRPDDARPTGHVNVVTPGGWAEIYDGHKKHGSTPARVELPVGFTQLKLVPFGVGPPEHVDVRVKRNEVVRVVVPVVPTGDEGT